MTTRIFLISGVAYLTYFKNKFVMAIDRCVRKPLYHMGNKISVPAHGIPVHRLVFKFHRLSLQFFPLPSTPSSSQDDIALPWSRILPNKQHNKVTYLCQCTFCFPRLPTNVIRASCPHKRILCWRESYQFEESPGSYNVWQSRYKQPFRHGGEGSRAFSGDRKKYTRSSMCRERFVPECHMTSVHDGEKYQRTIPPRHKGLTVIGRKAYRKQVNVDDQFVNAVSCKSMDINSRRR